MKSPPKQIVDDEAYEAVELHQEVRAEDREGEGDRLEVSRDRPVSASQSRPHAAWAASRSARARRRGDDSRVELAVRAAAELVDRLSRRDGAPVQAVGRHRDVGVAHRDDARGERISLPRGRPRSRSTSQRSCVERTIFPTSKSGAASRIRWPMTVWRRMNSTGLERPLLAEDRVRDGELADVVGLCGEP